MAILMGAAMALAACDDDGGLNNNGNSGPDGQIGDLGNGTFFYECTDDADYVCDDGRADFPFGDRFALQSTFGMKFRTADGRTGSVQSGSSSRLLDLGSVFQAAQTGRVSLIAFEGNHAADKIQIEIAEVADISLQADTATVTAEVEEGTLEMESGDSITLTVLPVDEDGKTLAGALPVTWTSGDLSVVGFAGSDTDNNVSLVADRNGEAEIYVEMGGFSQTLTVTVTGYTGPMDPGRPQDTVYHNVDYSIAYEGGAGGDGGGGAGGTGGAGGAGGQGGN